MVEKENYPCTENILYDQYFVILWESIYPQHLMPHTILLGHGIRLHNTFARVKNQTTNPRKHKKMTMSHQRKRKIQTTTKKKEKDMFH